MNWNVPQTERLAYINRITREDAEVDPRIKELSDAALKTCEDCMETLKKQNALFEREDQNGNVRTAAMSVKVTPSLDRKAEPTKQKINGKWQDIYPELKDKNGNQLYSVTAGISSKDGSSLSATFSNKINEDGTLDITNVYYAKFSNRNKVDDARGVEAILESKASDEIKNFTDALNKNGFIKNKGNELYNLTFHLNQDIFKTKVMVVEEQDGKKEDVERKLVNAQHKVHEKYGEQVMIFNKSSNPGDSSISVRIQEKDGELTAVAINSALTFVKGKGYVPKESNEDVSAMRNITDASDIANLLPAIDELRMAVAEVMDIDYNEVKKIAAEITEKDTADDKVPAKNNVANNDVVNNETNEQHKEAEEKIEDFMEIDDLPF